ISSISTASAGPLASDSETRHAIAPPRRDTRMRAGLLWSPRDDFRNDTRQLLRVRDRQELVRPVRIGLRTQHAGDHELRAWEPLAQHRDERYAAALAHPYRLPTERSDRRLVQRLLQPGRGRRCVPTRAGVFQIETHARAVGWIGFQQKLQA